MAEKKRQALRMPGRIYERFNELAQEQADQAAELDVCEAIANPRLKRHGSGYVVFLPLEVEQVERLMYWITDREAKPLRDYRDRVREAIEQHRRAAA